MSSTFLRFPVLTLLFAALLCACGASDDEPSDIDGDVEADAPADGDEEEETELPFEYPPVDLGAADGLTPRFDFADKADFFSSPFPNDTYIAADGKIRLPGFPNPRESTLVQTFLDVAQHDLKGFGNNAPIYWTFPAPIDPESLPADPSMALNQTSAVLLVNVDPDSEFYGRFTPLEWHWTPTGNGFEPDNLLAVAPANGFPLAPATTYACLLTDALLDADGQPLGRDQHNADLLSGREDALSAVYEPAAEWLRQAQGELDPERIRAATVFTTQDPVEELKIIRDYLAEEYPDGEVKGELLDCTFKKTKDNYLVFEGHYSSPNLQQGEVPYAEEGGGIFFDETGRPIVQRMEELRFALVVPAEATMPEDGWPISMIAHGTGGDYNTYINSEENGRSRRLIDAGIAAIGIDQPLHGPRGNDETNVELHSFNFLNPVAGRSNFRQSAVDTVALTHFIRSGKLALDKNFCDVWPRTDLYSGPERIFFDSERVLFHGHSHGGLSGALAAAVEDDVLAWTLSGAGGRMAITVMEREDPGILAIAALLAGFEKEEAYIHHPVLGLIQLLVEITDPLNYAPRWIESPYNGHARNVMMTSGFLDPYTPKDTASTLAVAGRLPQVENAEGNIDEAIPALDWLGIASFSRPAEDTVSGPDGESATSGFFQYPEYGHFPIFDSADAASLYQEWMRGIAYDGHGVFGY